MFAPADLWVSTEYLFRRDEDGDFWLVANRGSVIRTDRGPVFTDAVNDTLGRVGAVDLAVTYRVQVGDRELAVSALLLRPGGSVPTADLNEAIAGLPVGAAPDVVHVVSEMTLSATYRPLLGPLRAAGVPKQSRHAWYLDDDGTYKRLTAAARAELTDSADDE